MAVARSIVVGIIGDNKGLRNALTDSKNRTNAFQRVGKAVFRAVRLAALALTAAVVGVAKASVTAALEINKSMGEIATLIDGDTERVNELKKGIQELSIEVGKSTGDISKGVYQAISAFGDSEETLLTVGIAARAATAGVATTEQALNLLSAVTKGYGDVSAEAQQKAADLAFQTVVLGQTTFPELAASVGSVIPLAVELGVAQEELFAVMATGTGVTGTASEVSTQLRGVLQSLLSPTADMTGLIDELGYQSGNAMLEQLGLIGTIEKIVGASRESGKPLSNYIGLVRGQIIALALAGEQNDVYREKLGEMDKAQGAAARAFENYTTGVNSAGFALDQLKSQWGVFKERVGDILLPIVLNAINKLAPAMDNFLVAVEENLPKIIEWFEDASVKWNIFFNLYQKDVDEVTKKVKKSSKEIREEIEELNRIFPEYGEKAEEYLEPINIHFVDAGLSMKNFRETWESFVKSLNDDETNLGKTWDGIRDRFWISLGGVLDAIAGLIGSIEALINMDWSKLGENALSGMKGVFNLLMPSKDHNKPFITFTENLEKDSVEVGKSVGKGITKGLKESSKEVMSTVSEVTSEIIFTAAEGLQIKSPSKVFQWLGEMAMKGFGIGFEEEYQSVERTMKTIITDFQKSWTDIQENQEKKRLELNKDYWEDMKKISKQYQDEIDANNQEYVKKVEDRTRELTNIGGFFSPARKDTKFSRDDIFQSMAGQLEMLRLFEEFMDELKERNLPVEMLEELHALGPGAAYNLGEIAAMSDDDLVHLIGMWAEKRELSHNLAIKENEEFRIEIEGKNNLLLDEQQKALDERVEQWKQSGMILQHEYTIELNKLRMITGNGINNIIDEVKDHIPELIQAGASMGEAIISGMNMALAGESASYGIAGLNGLQSSLDGVNQQIASAPDYQPGRVLHNTYNIVTPEPLNEREIVRQVNLTSHALAMEMA